MSNNLKKYIKSEGIDLIFKMNDQAQTLNFIENFLVNQVLRDACVSIAWTGAGESFSQGISYETNTDNIAQIQREATTGTFNYVYDKTDQLTSTSYTGPLSLPTSLVNRTFSYDHAGNRKEDSENGTTKSSRNIVLENDNYTYFQDVEGLGRTTQISSKTQNLHDLFNYRPDGKLERFRRFENNNQTRDVRYYYDALGRRIAKKLTINTTTWTNTFTHLADQSRILLAKDGNDNQTLYIDGLGIDEHLAKIDANTKTFVTDHLGTVINGEAVSEKGVTGPFGENLGSDLTTDSSSPPVRYGFWGREHDSEKGTIFTPHRELDPRTGRWLTPDPISFDGGDANLYRGAGNNPVKFTDPMGLEVIYNHRFDNVRTRQGFNVIDQSYPGIDVVTTGGDRFFGSDGQIRSSTDGAVVAGSSQVSRHLSGHAGDFVLEKNEQRLNYTPVNLQDVAYQAGFGNVIQYPSGRYHVDAGTQVGNNNPQRNVCE